MLDHIDYLVFLVQVNQIQRKEYPKRMNSARRKYPESFIDPEPDLSNEAFQARECRVGRKDTEAEKALARLVIYAIGLSFHLCN